ncbi:hypothetical protein V6N13_052691 [Hibiscus sabdariffa]
MVLVQPPPDVLVSGAKQWSNVLIGNFLSKYPPLNVFQRTADRLWGREGSVVLELGTWHIQQKTIVLREWTPGMLLEVLALDTAPVWIKLWHVPLELYSQQGLAYITSALGKSLYTDKATTLKHHLEFAKVRVNISAGDVLPSAILVDLGYDNTVSVQVELVWSLPRCSHCSIFGHVEEICMKIKSVAMHVVVIDNVVEYVDNINASTFFVEEDVLEGPGKPVADVNLVSVGVGFVEGTGNVGSKSCEFSVRRCGRKVVSPRKGRVAAEGFAELMQQLKPKAKEQN